MTSRRRERQYKYVPPCPLEEIETDWSKIEAEIAEMLGKMTKP